MAEHLRNISTDPSYVVPNTGVNSSDQEWYSSDNFVGPSDGYPPSTADASAIIPTPVSSCDSVIPDPRHSPGQAVYSRDTHYEAVASHAAQGLGISMVPFGYAAPTSFGTSPSQPPGITAPGANLTRSHPGMSPSNRQTEQSPNIRPLRPLAPRPSTAPTQAAGSSANKRGGEPPKPKPRRQSRKRKSPQDEAIDEYTEYLYLQKSQSKKDGHIWKQVTPIVNSHFNTKLSETCLQMRLHRRRIQRAQWSEGDTQLLQRALELSQERKFEIIAQNLKELGATTAWTSSACRSKLYELDRFPIPAAAIEQQERQDMGTNRNRKRPVPAAPPAELPGPPPCRRTRR